MKPDYELKIQEHFSSYLSNLTETIALTNDLGRIISEKCSILTLLETCLDFSKISVDTTKCILEMLKQGHIAQSFVLLRWYLGKRICFISYGRILASSLNG